MKTKKQKNIKTKNIKTRIYAFGVIPTKFVLVKTGSGNSEIMLVLEFHRGLTRIPPMAIGGMTEKQKNNFVGANPCGRPK